MGRKNRNKVSKDDDHTKEVQISEEKNIEYQEKIEEKIDIIEKQTYDRMSSIYDARNRMIEYCDEMAIPLCDYMTFNIFNSFVEYLEEHK